MVASAVGPAARFFQSRCFRDRDWPVKLLLLLLPLGLYSAPLSGAVFLPLLAAAGAWRLRGGVAAETGGAAPGGGFPRLALPWLPFLAYALLSSAWALDAGSAISLALRLILLFGCGLFLLDRLRRLDPERLAALLAALAWGFVVISVLVLLDFASGGLVARHLHKAADDAFMARNVYSRGSAVHAVLAVPLALGLFRAGRWRLALGFLALSLLVVLDGSQLAAKLALLLGLVAALAVFLVPRLRWLLLAGWAAAILLLPWLILPVHLAAPADWPHGLPQGRSLGLFEGWTFEGGRLHLPGDTLCRMVETKPSALHRLYIWDFADQRIREKPLFGWGLDAARRIPGGQDHVVAPHCPPFPNLPPAIDAQLLPLHPHNAILQVWLELGLAGGLLGTAALLTGLGRRFAFQGGGNPTRQRAVWALVAGTGLAGTLSGLVSFGIWQEWWIAMLLLAAAVAAGSARLFEAERGLRK